MILSDVIQNWKDYLNHSLNYSAHTQRAYAQDVDSFIHFLDMTQKDVSDVSYISYKHFREWLVQRHENSLSPRSTARALSAIKNFFQYIDIHHHISNDHISKVQAPKVRKGLPKPIHVDDVKELIDNPIISDTTPKWILLRNQALLSLLYGCGLRISEALSLNIKDVIDTYVKFNDFITIKGKGNKERIVPLHSALQEKILPYIHAHPKKEDITSPLFIGIQGKRLNQSVVQKWHRDYRNLYGLPEHLTPHALRHSCATHLLSNNAPLRSIQELLGHASPSTTQIYTAVEDKRITEAIEKAHPREQRK